jgi:hypothetical protein
MIREVSKIIIVHKLDLEKRYVGEAGQVPFAVKVEGRTQGLRTQWHLHTVSDCSAAGSQEHFNLKLFIKNCVNQIAYWKRCKDDKSFSKEECERYTEEYSRVIQACHNLSKVALANQMICEDDDEDQVFFSIANSRPSVANPNQATNTMIWVHRGLQKGVQTGSKAWISVAADDHFIAHEEYLIQQAKAAQELYEKRYTSRQATT